jgi:hypothetical protein
MANQSRAARDDRGWRQAGSGRYGAVYTRARRPHGKLKASSRRALPSPHRHQLRCWHPEFLRRFFDGGAFVGGFDLTKPRLFGSDLVDGPCRQLRRCRLACHVSLVPVAAWPTVEASCEQRSRGFRHRRPWCHRTTRFAHGSFQGRPGSTDGRAGTLSACFCSTSRPATACSPVSTSIGASPWHHGHRSPRTRLPMLASR